LGWCQLLVIGALAWLLAVALKNENGGSVGDGLVELAWRELVDLAGGKLREISALAARAGTIG